MPETVQIELTLRSESKTS